MTTVTKLSRQADAEGGPRTITPKGWGRPAAIAQDPVMQDRVVEGASNNVEEQRERIQQTLKGEVAGNYEAQAQVDTGPTPAERARAAFSPAVRAALEGTTQTAIHPDDQGKPVADATTSYMPPTEKPATASPATADVAKATEKRRRSPANTEATAAMPPLCYDYATSLRLEIIRLAPHDSASWPVMLEFLTAA